jgi:hypothetical protein
MLRWLADPRLKLRKEFAAAVNLFLHGATVPAKASSKTTTKQKKKGIVRYRDERMGQFATGNRVVSGGVTSKS